MDVYSFNINPVPSSPNWKSSGLPPLIPPIARKQAGRPRKERKRAQDESRKDSTRASKQGVAMICGKCMQPDHNARICSICPPTTFIIAFIPRTASSQSVGRSRGRPSSRGRASSSARSRGASASARVRVFGRGVASAAGEVHVQGHGLARATALASGIGIGRDGSNTAQGRPFNE